MFPSIEKKKDSTDVSVLKLFSLNCFLESTFMCLFKVIYEYSLKNKITIKFSLIKTSITLLLPFLFSPLLSWESQFYLFLCILVFAYMYQIMCLHYTFSSIHSFSHFIILQMCLLCDCTFFLFVNNKELWFTMLLIVEF